MNVKSTKTPFKSLELDMAVAIYPPLSIQCLQRQTEITHYNSVVTLRELSALC